MQAVLWYDILTRHQNGGPAMELSWVQKGIWSVIQGLAGVVPLSSVGLLAVMRKIFGLPMDGSADRGYAAMQLLAVAVTIAFSFRHDYAACFRATHGRLPRNDPEQREAMLLNRRLFMLILIGVIPAAFALLFRQRVAELAYRLSFMVGLFALGGFVVFLGDRIGKGERKLQDATIADGLWMGLAHGLGIIPGLPAMGLCLTAGVMCGLESVFAMRYAFLISAPVLFLEAVSEWTASAAPFHWIWLAGMIPTALCAYGGISFMKKMAKRDGYGLFAYLLWGSAILTFILFLIS